jgi:hypothetical protein
LWRGASWNTAAVLELGAVLTAIVTPFEAQPTGPSVGTDPLPEEVFLNSQGSAYYCENAAPGHFAATGTYPSGPKAGKGCWLYEQPAIEVKKP